MSAPTLAELLAEHMLYDRYEGPQCSCGAAVLTSSLLTTHRGQWHRAHLAAVIEDSDWLRERIDHADEEGARWQDRAERAEAERDGWHEAFNDRLAELQGYAGGIAEAEAERDAAREALARVEALAEWHETKADKARRFRPEVNGENRLMDKAAEVHDDAARRLRAALAQPEDGAR